MAHICVSRQHGVKKNVCITTYVSQLTCILPLAPAQMDPTDPAVQELLRNLLQLNLSPALNLSPSLNLPQGIEQYQQFAPQGQYAALAAEVPFQAMMWGQGRQARPLKRLTCRLSPDEMTHYPTLHRVVDSALCSHPLFENARCDGLWINHYRNGLDVTPYHQDNYGAAVMMISVGGTRDLLTRRTQRAPGEKATKWACNDGDITVFTPEWDRDHEHSVPERKTAVTGRISIVVFLK